jgi:(E)-4-hydroxy-3-methylbut-2-enyl-diphosphate synthase
MLNRRKTITVDIGNVPVGSDHPVRLQSMTTTDTMDTRASVDQAIRMIEAGCEIVRLTAPSINEAKNLENIKNELRAQGYLTPLVADIHFTPNAAEVAANIVEKVRINPGNYVDKKKFQTLEYTDDEYKEEIERIRERFTPLVHLCKKNKVALRIGTNHGSLSDRIMSRFGDTPLGMVESALEFIRICRENDFHQLVISMKSSNPQVMIEAYRLLVRKMDAEDMHYPLHLGVTEAGEGEDGRIKSAIGIGTLLQEGIGDTIRVSLTEDPEFEIPVAKILAERYTLEPGDNFHLLQDPAFDPFAFHRRSTFEVLNFGGTNVPRVIADLSDKEITEFELMQTGYTYDPVSDKWNSSDLACDYIYTGKQLPGFMLPNGLRAIMDHELWNEHKHAYAYPLFHLDKINKKDKHPVLNFLEYSLEEYRTGELFEALRINPSFVLILTSDNNHSLLPLKEFFFSMVNAGIANPVVIKKMYPNENMECFTLCSAVDTGGLLIDGFGDGIMLSTHAVSQAKVNSVAFGILQAARTRISKTEYISCPSCGRTLFDLQETTAMIRSKTDHLKGIKIAIMGCIVNGPGEMADADYGYVGSGPGKITLYRGKEVIKKGINKETAVEELIEIIASDGNWVPKPGMQS